MNKEKLINIILKDIQELKEISEEIKNDNSNISIETDIALSKANIILQEFQLLKEKYSDGSVQPTIEENKKIDLPDQATPEIGEPEVSSQKIQEEPQNEIEKPKEDITTETEEFEEAEGLEVEEYEEEPEENPDDDETTEEAEQPSEIKKTIGENFHSEKLLNDLMGNSNTLDQKFAHSSISNIQSAIGINDRFLFIREIFDNDAELYTKTIKQIDNCENLRQAVDYLSSNFKIKKTETSLKFVELIKRRFAK